MMANLGMRALLTRHFFIAILCALPVMADAKPQFILPETPLDNIINIAVGDLDGDGKLDVVSDTDDFVSGNGDGTFGYTQGLFFIPGVNHVAVGDVNGDGIADIVIAEFSGSPSAVRVLIGLGNGKFASPTSYFVGNTPGNLVLMDLNGDHKLDITLVNVAENTVGVLMGNGDGTFQAQKTYAVHGATNLAVADINKDGIPDVVTVDGNNTLSILLGKGDGSFKAAATVTGFDFPIALALGDIDGDGNVDVVTSDGQELPGNGDGTFRAPIALASPTGNAWESVTLGDLNSDGHLDLVVTDIMSNVIVMLNDSHGAFTNVRAYPIGAGASGSVTPVLADINGDKHLDIVVPIPNDATIVTMLNNDDGTFPQPSSLPLTRVTAIKALDVNGDGKIDIVTADGDDTMKVELGNGDGSFQAPSSYPTGQLPSALLPVNTIANGHPDFVIAAGTSVETWLNDGHGAFTHGTTQSLPVGAIVLGAGDFNGDGHLDVITGINGSPTFALYFYPGRSNGSFGAAVSIAYMPPSGDFINSAYATDVNDDRKLDLVIATSTDVIVLLGDGKGGFTEAQHDGPGCALPAKVLVQDMNKDGKLDIICGYSIRYGNGDGTFQPLSEISILAAPPPGGTYPTQDGPPAGAVVADANGDGLPDIVTCGGYSAMTVALQGPAGRFHSESAYEMGSQLSACAVADVNADGRSDLIAATMQVTNAVTISTQLISEHPPVLHGHTINTGINLSTAGQFAGADIDADPLLYFVAVFPKNGTVKLDKMTGAFSYFSSTGLSDSFMVVADDGTEFSAGAAVTVAGASSGGSGNSPGKSGGGEFSIFVLLPLLGFVIRRRTIVWRCALDKLASSRTASNPTSA